MLFFMSSIPENRIFNFWPVFDDRFLCASHLACLFGTSADIFALLLFYELSTLHLFCKGQTFVETT